ncbi:Predicted DNA-binding transcriptional regulator YafY, contains an HTH and WYL domains [Roseateles sp. YR242]|uniref:helix-turn-helix transcriptional regulator n=1 Tax=Roseateles sp. YR242 TaxID=1855305 RepID=UPI0008D7D9E1|nr:YafY family protein [Roseateles sp. YR242]SEL08257.1 Predicted DNA-binding transcriptional regulator YafY, contains an HTH and WYL domains [Roseateles sp. YR242]
MSKPASRVLVLLELLQSRGQVDGATLAHELQVERRTVRRYIAALEDLGIPIQAERGRFGGYRLMPGYRLPPMMFSDDEALAIGLGLLAVRQLGWADASPAVASAQAKLERVLPAALQKRQRGISQRVALDLKPTRDAADPAVIAALGAAAFSQQRMRMVYQDVQGQRSERDFDPYGLGFRGGHWYAVGFCGLRQAMRSFRLDRIDSVEPLPQSFGRPESFDVLAHLQASMVRVPRAHAVHLKVQAPLEALVQQPLAAISSLESGVDGVLLQCQIDDLAWMARSLAALPFDFKILQPPALVAALRTVAQELALRADQSS